MEWAGVPLADALLWRPVEWAGGPLSLLPFPRVAWEGDSMPRNLNSQVEFARNSIVVVRVHGGVSSFEELDRHQRVYT